MRESIAAARIGEPRPDGDGRTVLEFKFAASDPVFAGHFPGRPILPGVFQLELAHVAAELVLKCALATRTIFTELQNIHLPTKHMNSKCVIATMQRVDPWNGQPVFQKCGGDATIASAQ